MRRLLVALFCLSLSACSSNAERLTVTTASGAQHVFEVELALTDAEQQRGLMFREALASNAGMLFFFEECKPASFWMKNTLIPLDMIFIEADGRITSIARMTEPESLVPHGSDGAVNGVLEIRGGRSDELGISEGDYIQHEWFGDEGRATCLQE